MDLVFNELSLLNRPRSTIQADSWLKYFFYCAIEISKRRSVPVSILATVSFKEIMISPTYAFSHWLSKQTDIEYMRLVSSLISKKPVIQDYPYYYYNKADVKGLGIAHFQNFFSLSYPRESWGKTIQLTKEEFDINEEVVKSFAVVRNISDEWHLNTYFPKRFFDHHLKHDNNRLNLEDGESTLLYNIPSEQHKVERLLNTASGNSNSSSAKLFNWDENKKLFIEFQVHLRNRYHGYHIKDITRVPVHIRRKFQ